MTLRRKLAWLTGTIAGLLLLMLFVAAGGIMTVSRPEAASSGLPDSTPAAGQSAATPTSPGSAAPTPATTPTPVASPTPATPDELATACLNAQKLVRIYYANKVTGNRFGHPGPAAGTQPDMAVSDTAGDIITRLCHDPRLWAAYEAAIGEGGNPNVDPGDIAWTNGVVNLIRHQIDWTTVKIERRHFDNDALTLDMHHGTFPRIGVASATKHDGTFVVLTIRDYHNVVHVLVLNPDCGYQPYFGGVAELPATLLGLAA